MKKIKFTLLAFMVAMMTFSFTACSDDDDIPPTPEHPDQEENKPTPEPEESNYHFDLYMTIGKHGGMSSKNTTIVRSVDNLNAGQELISITGVGTELGDYTMECISNGKYYYQVNSDNAYFTKYQIKNNKIEVVAQRPFGQNTYKARSYTHAWTDDNTLVIMASTGDYQKLIWTKLNVTDMSIIDEGELDVKVADNYENFSTSGILTYRKSDGKLYYFYFCRTGTGVRATKEPRFHTLVLDPTTMIVEKEHVVFKDCEMAGSAYGELMQNSVMYDENDNLYLAAFDGSGDIDRGYLLRIKKGETEFDPTYEGFPDADGKLLTIQYLANGKALTYSRNDKAPVDKPTDISGYSHYYSIVDLATGKRSRLQYNGQDIPYSAGRFSQRSVIFNGKAFIGTSIESEANSIIYIYDLKTGSVEKGAEIEGVHYFDMIRIIEND